LLAALAMVAAADYSTGNEHSWNAPDIVHMRLAVGGSALPGKNIMYTVKSSLVFSLTEVCSVLTIFPKKKEGKHRSYY